MHCSRHMWPSGAERLGILRVVLFNEINHLDSYRNNDHTY